MYSTVYAVIIADSRMFNLLLPCSLKRDIMRIGRNNSRMQGNYARMCPYDVCLIIFRASDSMYSRYRF